MSEDAPQVIFHWDEAPALPALWRKRPSSSERSPRHERANEPQAHEPAYGEWFLRKHGGFALMAAVAGARVTSR